MQKKRFYVNCRFWKELPVSEKEMNQSYKEYSVSTKPPDVPQSVDDVPESVMCTMKRIYFRLNSTGIFIIEDDELYIEDGCLYLKERKWQSYRYTENVTFR